MNGELNKQIQKHEEENKSLKEELDLSKLLIREMEQKIARKEKEHQQQISQLIAERNNNSSSSTNGSSNSSRGNVGDILDSNSEGTINELRKQLQDQKAKMDRITTLITQLGNHLILIIIIIDYYHYKELNIIPVHTI